MNIKRCIYDLCFKNKLMKSLYIGGSHIKGKIKYGFSMAYPIYKYKRNKHTPVFLVFTPEHANLGDHAIAYSETLVLKKANIDYYEITGRELYVLNQYGYLGILNNSIILVNGGGNLGILWPDIEKMNRAIITKNPESFIYILPNSIYYGDDEYGKNEFEISKKIYNSHKNLYLYARERISYEIMKAAYTNVKLVPDMVLALNESRAGGKRKGCLLCMRNDVERTLLDDEEQQIRKIVEVLFSTEVKEINTVLTYCVSILNRESELKRKFDEFREAELVITDRLHGMIFAAITGTNCIALNSRSAKLQGCYQWLSGLGYIKFANDVNEILTLYKEMPEYPHPYYNDDILKLMEELRRDINVVISSNN